MLLADDISSNALPPVLISAFITTFSLIPHRVLTSKLHSQAHFSDLVSSRKERLPLLFHSSFAEVHMASWPLAEQSLLCRKDVPSSGCIDRKVELGHHGKCFIMHVGSRRLKSGNAIRNEAEHFDMHLHPRLHSHDTLVESVFICH